MSAPDRWLELSARLPASDPLRELLGDGLLALGGLSVEQRGDELVTYLPPPAEDPESFVRSAGEFLADWMMDDAAPDLSWRWQRNEDWEQEWRRGLQPRRVTDRIVVKPSWTEWTQEPGQIVIDIDPQMAFGTGEHGTTRGCLRLLDGTVRPGDRVLDVGSGSGILSIAAALLGAAEVVAVEYDEDANINARENIDRSGTGDRVRLIEALADEAMLDGLGGFDVVVANILSGVIRPLLPAFRRALGGGAVGRLIVSGILKTEHEDVVRDAEAAGFRVERIEPEDEWWSALLVPHAEKTLFTRIIDGEIPGDFVYRDEHVVAIRDIAPAAPVHVLVIPRKPIASLDELTSGDGELAGRLLLAVAEIARREGLESGYRVVINTGEEGGQTVPHLHLHLLGGKRFTEGSMRG